ncbi:MAG: hypothetical protein Pg6C_04090 [Treponemataceae bacterium]|nr:MAG: hypothetical protein Pg6C_04090 [Treponemataceae bacterium]
MANDFLGKKVFFLYPPAAIQDEMFDALVMNGFETYALKDHERAFRILQKFPESILFINIDSVLKEPAWEKYIKRIRDLPKTQGVGLGIFSSNDNAALKEKYLNEFGIKYGFLQSKMGVKEITKAVMRILYADDARGRRTSIRISCESDPSAKLNYKSLSQNMYYGKILDISSAGFAALIPKLEEMPSNIMLKEIQLILRGAIVMVDAIFVGKREDNPNVRIFIFDTKMTPYNKLTIHRFIKQSLQRSIDQMPI